MAGEANDSILKGVVSDIGDSTDIAVSDDGSEVVTDLTALDFTDELTVSDAGSGQAEIAGLEVTEVEAETKSGDGSTKTFSFSHSHSTVPGAVMVQPRSVDADGDFYLSEKTASTFDITYATAPDDDTDNLIYEYILIGQGNPFSTQTETVLEDFESFNSADYDVESGYSTTTTDPIEGTTSMTCTETFNEVYYTGSDDVTTRGNEYRCKIRPVGQTAFFVSAANTSPSVAQRSYMAIADEDGNALYVRKWDSASNTDDVTSVTLNQDVEYQLGIRFGETGVTDNIEAFVMDANGTELASVAMTDDDFTGGVWGFRSNDGTGDYWDYVTEHPL